MTAQSRRKGRPKSWAAEAKFQPIQALDRGFDVLDALAEGGGQTLTELSTQLGQSAATIHRVLATLEARGIVELDRATQGWRIGPIAFRLGSAFLRRASVIERSQPVMRELMEATGETSNLGIVRGTDVMFVSQIETPATIRAFFPPGTLSPIHASGIGKALLSRYDERRFARFLRQAKLSTFTDKTITNADALTADMVATRARGWSYDDEEKAMGMRCIAAPILNAYGEAVAGISISGPTHRLPEARIDEIGRLVKQAAFSVSISIGAPESAFVTEA